MPDFKAVIKKLAQEMGFDKVGITHPALLEEGERALESWVHEGRHGSMKYLENFSKRKQRFYEGMPDAKSVIVLGVNYYSKNEIASSASPPRNDSEVVIASERSERSNLAFKGRVARYAWGKDYHEVIRKKHESFIRQLKKNLGKDFRAVSCVDTQPIPERFAAVQAGFGFIGKHTVLLNQKFGPWFFLSEIVTNLELEEDINHEEGNCGTCNHCQTVCPTGALDKDYEIDARRCIAYLTIEHKGVIDRALRPFVKDWIFGCDECLNICPFTAKAKETSWEEFRPDQGKGGWLNLKELFEISSNREYEKYFQQTALLRAGRKQMLRNACLVLANSGKEEAIPYLEKALSDSSTLVRLHAAWGLGQFQSRAARQILENHRQKEKNPEVKAEIEIIFSENPEKKGHGNAVNTKGRKTVISH